MIEIKDKIKVGIITKPHGVSGELIIRANVGFVTEDFCYEFLFVEIDGGLVPYHVASTRDKNTEESIIKFDFVNTQEDARRLSGMSVYIDSEWVEQNSNDDDISVGMLIGYTCYNQNNKCIGQIEEIDEQNGTNPLFVVNNEGKEVLIPIVDDLIVDINTEEKRIIFDLPEGLIEL